MFFVADEVYKFSVRRLVIIQTTAASAIAKIITVLKNLISAPSQESKKRDDQLKLST